MAHQAGLFDGAASNPLELPERVRVISLWHLWAARVRSGQKTIETRRWPWPYPAGWLVIFDQDAFPTDWPDHAADNRPPWVFRWCVVGVRAYDAAQAIERALRHQFHPDDPTTQRGHHVMPTPPAYGALPAHTGNLARAISVAPIPWPRGAKPVRSYAVPALPRAPLDCYVAPADARAP